jgi:O-antigen ligase
MQSMEIQKLKIHNYFDLIGIVVALLCVATGELFRFKGMLLLDLWAPLFLGLWVAKEFMLSFEEKRHFFADKNLNKSMICAAFFCSIGLGSLLVNSSYLETSETLKAAFYGLRWASLFGFFIVASRLNPLQKKIAQTSTLILGTWLAIAGFVQLLIYPNFGEMTSLGWDPHQGRLLSTWFDPNFLGGFFAFLLPILGGTLWDTKITSKRWKFPSLLALIFIVILAALFLTYSRSAYLALLTGMGLFGLLRSRKWLVIGLILCGLFVGISERGRERVLDLAHSVESVFTENYRLPDPSGRLRFASWEGGVQLFLESPWIGQGYNRYADAALHSGAVKDLKGHSASGSDSSLITILATTGIFGLGAWLTLMVIIVRNLWSQRKNSLALGTLCGLSGLFIHSIFVNSLLFPLLLLPLWLCLGLAWKSDQPR